jgi:hypothetical protein
MTANPFQSIDPPAPRKRGRPSGEDVGDPAEPGPDYSVTKFYTRASDAQGHHRHLAGTQYTPTMHAAILAIVDDCPELKNVDDFRRNADVHFAVYYHEHKGDLTLWAKCQAAVLEAESEHRWAETERWTKYLHTTQERLRAYAEAGDRDALDEELKGLREYLTFLRPPFVQRGQDILETYQRPRFDVVPPA